MHRIDDPTAVPTLPAPRPQGTPGYFTGGSPGSSGFAATIVRYEFMNALQEELATVVEAAQLVLDKTNNGQLLAALRKVLRFKLTADTTFFIAPTGNDNNDGLTAATPFLTGQAAWNRAMTVDLNNHNLFLQFAHGTYPGTINCTGRPLGLGSGNNVWLQGDNAQPDSVILSATNAVCVNAQVGSTLVVQGLTLKATGIPGGPTAPPIGVGLLSGSASSVYLGSNVVFDQCDSCHMQAFSGNLSSGGNAYRIKGPATRHMLALAGGYCGNANSAVSITGTPNFSDAFALAATGGVLDGYSVAYSGAATGVRYKVGTNATIITYGAPATYFPGSVAGVVDAATFGVII